MATIDLTESGSDEEPTPCGKRRRDEASSSSSSAAPARQHWHPAVRAQSAGALLELPGGAMIARAGVSAKAIICLDRLAVIYGSLRAAYSKGYAYIRTPYPPTSPHHPFHRNEFTLPGSSRRISAGPMVRHLKELEARARGEAPKGGPLPWFDDDKALVAAARARHAPFAPRAQDERADEALQQALRASAAQHDAAAVEAAELEEALRASRQLW